MPTRPLYLTASLCPPGLRRHHSLFIPIINSNPLKGNRIHATGGPSRGYKLEFHRNCIPDVEFEDYTITKIGDIDEKYIVDPKEEENGRDCELTDELQKVAKGVEAPGVTKELPKLSRDKDVLWDCQSWVRKFVRELIRLGWVDGGALEVLWGKSDAVDLGDEDGKDV